MKKINDINNYLLYLQKIMDKNPNIGPNEMYSLIVYYKASSKSINYLFDPWIKYFNDHQNISVFVSETWRYFCQFTNDRGCNTAKMLKLYIPLSEKYIEEGAKLIFEYLAQNNIKHHSKIGSHCRNDNIVIRINSVSDAYKIENFVKNNKFLSKGLMPTNPFLFNENGVGMAFDGNKSYNEELSKVLLNYFKSRRNSGINTKPNSVEFVNYLQYILSKTKDRDLIHIYGLICANASKEEFSFDDYVLLADKFQDNKNTLFRALLNTRRKYGTKQMISAIVALKDGDARYITNDYGSRDEIIRYLSYSQVQGIINNECNIDRNKVLSMETLIKFNNRLLHSSNDDKRISNTLLNASIKTNNIHPNNSVYSIIYNFLRTGNYNLFTRSDGVRESVISLLSDCNNFLELLQTELGLEKNSSINLITEKIIKLKDLDNETSHIR